MGIQISLIHCMYSEYDDETIRDYQDSCSVTQHLQNSHVPSLPQIPKELTHPMEVVMPSESVMDDIPSCDVDTSFHQTACY